jgi:arylsulfatase A-like enzyme
MADQTNLLFITIDSLRRDAVGCLGQPGSSPNLDQLAARGALFRQAIANGPRTPSSFPSIMCSVYALLCGEQGCPDNATTWAEAMSAGGYRTAGFCPDNPYLAAECGYGRGFDRYEEFGHSTQPETRRRRPGLLRRWMRAVRYFLVRRNLVFSMFLEGMLARRKPSLVAGEKATDRAVDWMAGDHGRPFFCWLHFMEVHYPYHPLGRPVTFRDRLRCFLAMLSVLCRSYRYPVRVLRELYAERVRYTDGVVGRLMQALRERGLDKNTVVVVTADHGDMFNEHGDFTHNAAPYDELLRVPLIVADPRAGAPRVVEEQMALMDLAPTMLEMLGLPRPATFQGSSRWTAIQGASAWDLSCVFSEATHRGGRKSRRQTSSKYRIFSCRSPEWKYIYDEEGTTRELYDLKADPGETTNLVERETDKAREMEALMRAHLQMLDAECKRYTRAKNPWELEEDEDIRRRLEALGYL